MGSRSEAVGELLDLIAPKLTDRADRTFLDEVQNFNGDPDDLWLDSKIKAKTKKWLDAHKG
ncbi:hypothetical protein [Streptomyces sp. NPDC058254]|uniref:hypothetical protein n=1 Tax=Streptomyces sp. NPDC058254 TaxID=3346406 RepID=UPI0036E45ED4